jgi:serine/threonine protein phosphatase 1
VKFAISDIHGCRRTFESLLEGIGLTKSDSLFLLGDYIDRGPDSKGVIDAILQLQKDGYSVRCLRGNHEQMMLDARNDRDELRRWLRAGGIETLDSFGVAEIAHIPEEYLHFLENLEYYIEDEGCILVHAGLGFAGPDPLADRESMLWKRSWYPDIDKKWLGNRVIVHGHTPQTLSQTQAQLAALSDQQYLNIDNGCVYHDRFQSAEMGNLVAFELTRRRLTWQQYVG